MKKYLVLILFSVLAISELQAQYGGYGRGGYGNGYGRGGYGSQRSSIPSAGPTQAEPEEVKPSDIVEERLPDYQAEFNLDAFKLEVLRNILEDYYATLIALQKDKTMDAESMRKSYESEQKDLKASLTGILSKEDVEKLVAMDFSPKAVKKRKKARENE
ncbi:hypothetical protein [Flavimarina sp. Hel_I_48]|uniref:hypothetical protein n=1 Tax=Flavimarina sp. Hel_I_48 TaxID=1392488 RepID=UPI0006896102|nr:hypothetical protein [Flavimarina sp. Hel_I_48]